MKRPTLALLFVVLAFPACQTVHRAAVGTFRVIDAPHQYIRRKVVGDEQAPTPAEANIPAEGPTYPQRFREQAPPAPASEQRVVTTERRDQTQSEATPPPPPRVTTRTSTNRSPGTAATASAPPKSASAGDSGIPYGKPVPGKPGYVFSPFNKNGGYVDVTGFAPGSKVKDPYSGKVFLVP